MSRSARDVPAEVEAKLLVTCPADVQALVRLERLGPYAIRSRDPVRLRSIYVDTAEFTLAREGIALRLRRSGDGWEVTAKWPGSVSGVVHTRPELTLSLERAPVFPFFLPSGALQQHLRAWVAGRPLAPIVVTEIHRRLFDVMSAAAADPRQLLAELAVDRVRIHAPGQRTAAAAYYEVEIEQRQGRRRDVAAVAHLLQQRFNLRPATDSKFRHGLRVLYGAVPAMRPVVVQALDTLGDATRTIVAFNLRRLRNCDRDTRRGDDPEALHSMRVATRRLRAAVRTFEEGMPRQTQAALRAELAWLGPLLGSVRDLDVQLGVLDGYRRTAVTPHAGTLAAFRAHLQGEREHARAAMLAGLESGRYARLLLRLERFANGRAARRGVFREPIVVVGRRAIKRAWRRLLKQGHGIGETPSDTDFHALRIRAKRLRYLLEFLRELTGKPGRRLMQHLIRLQDVLGVHHDAVVAAGFIHRYVDGVGGHLPTSAVLALGGFASAELRQADNARTTFQKAWRQFSRPRSSKDVEALVEQLRGQTVADGSTAAAQRGHDVK